MCGVCECEKLRKGEGRTGERENGRRENGRKGEREKGRKGEREKGRRKGRVYQVGHRMRQGHDVYLAGSTGS
jgi:hypothetical protein